MKIGCCLNLLATSEDPTGIEQIEMLAALGYDYIELPMTKVMELSDEEFDVLCRRVKASGIPCRSFSNLLPGSLRVTGPNADYGKLRTYLKTATERAGKLGASVIVFGSPAARNVEGDYPRELAMVEFIKTLQIMDEYASEDLPIAIEHVCHLEGNLVYTVEESCKVLEVLQTKHIGILADTYHMAVENEPLEHLLLAGKNLLHVHTANPTGRVYPAPGDGVDYKKLMTILHTIGYNGGVSVEAFPNNPAEDARLALQALRQADRQH